MAHTVGDIVSTVQTEVKNTTLSATTFKEWYNDFKKDLANDKRWRFFESSQNYTLNIGTADITNGAGLPSDYQIANKVIITAAGFEGPLKHIAFEDLVTHYPDYMNADNGTPMYWFDYGGTIQTFPASDAAHTLTLHYYSIPAEQTTDSDVPEFSADFREVLKAGIKKRYYDYWDDQDKAQLEQIKIDEMVLDLAKRYASRQIGTPRIMPKATRRSNVVRG